MNKELIIAAALKIKEILEQEGCNFFCFDEYFNEGFNPCFPSDGGDLELIAYNNYFYELKTPLGSLSFGSYGCNPSNPGIRQLSDKLFLTYKRESIPNPHEKFTAYRVDVDKLMGE